MSLNSITEKIKQEANEYKASVLAKTEATKNELIEIAQKDANDIIEDYKSRSLKDAKILVERRKSVADLECRKLMLNMKQDIIDSCFDGALSLFLNLDDDKYLDFLLGQLKKHSDEGGEILLNSKDSARIGNKLVSMLGDKFSLSQETANIQGGVLLKQGNVIMNASIETLMDNLKQDIGASVAKELFD